MNIVAIIQARMGSKRLPGKVLKDLNGKSMLEHVYERTNAFCGVDEVIVATSVLDSDKPIVSLCIERGWGFFCGSELDVLDRYYQAAIQYKADHIVRVTSDCPFLCFDEGSRLLAAHLESHADYTHNITVLDSLMPMGTGAEVLSFSALEKSWIEGKKDWYREHVDEYILENPKLFSIENVFASEPVRRPHYRLTVDCEEDLQLIKSLYNALNRESGLIRLIDVIDLLDAEPERLEINSEINQK